MATGRALDLGNTKPEENSNEKTKKEKKVGVRVISPLVVEIGIIP